MLDALEGGDLLGRLADETAEAAGLPEFPGARVGRVDGEVVGSDLAAVLFELVELVGDEPADDLITVHRRQRDDVRLRQELREVGVGRWIADIAHPILERVGKHGEHAAHERGVGGGEVVDHEAHADLLHAMVAMIELLPSEAKRTNLSSNFCVLKALCKDFPFL